MAKCPSTNTNGDPCNATVPEGKSYCRWHDPDRAEDRRAWSQKGGRNRSTLARLRKQWAGERLTAEEVEGLLSSAMVAAMEGRIDPGVLSALASAARALHGVYQVARLEETIAAIEAHDKQRGGVA